MLVEFIGGPFHRQRHDVSAVGDHPQNLPYTWRVVGPVPETFSVYDTAPTGYGYAVYIRREWAMPLFGSTVVRGRVAGQLTDMLCSCPHHRTLEGQQVVIVYVHDSIDGAQLARITTVERPACVAAVGGDF